MVSSKPILWLGLDVGSITVKTVVFNPKTKEILHSHHGRHNAQQLETLFDLLKQIFKKLYFV